MEIMALLCWIGIVYGGYCVLAYLIESVRRHTAGMWPRDMLKEYGEGSWALVTGASDGIGEGLAKELARRGFNICLVSRTQSKLERVASDIRSLYPKCQTKIVVADLCRSLTSPEMFEAIYEDVKLLDLSILINCAGLYDVGLFEDQPEEKHINEINVNLAAVLRLTRKLVPLLLDHTKKTTKRSGIINVSSVAGILVCPTSALYSATKAAVLMFSKCLQAQYKGQIDVLSLNPMLVSSAMTRNRKAFDSVTPEACAKSSLPKLGRVSMTTGHWLHEIQYTILQALPSFIADRIQHRKLYQLLDVYNRIDAAANPKKKSQ